MANLGIKFDSDKLQWRLLPWKALEEVAKVVTDGAVKYSPDNWKYVKPFEDRYLDATIRHLVAYIQGEVDDPDSGSNHLAHAVANMLFLIEGPEECQDTISPATTATSMQTKTNTGKSLETYQTTTRKYFVPSVMPPCVASIPYSVSSSTDQDLPGGD